MSSQIGNLINPVRLRLGIKRAFTGDINEILSECFQFYFFLFVCTRCELNVSGRYPLYILKICMSMT
jgi:hypothetical protein